MFFEISERLCKRYPSLDPFRIRRERFGEVMRLISRISASVPEAEKQTTVWYDEKGDKHIRRPALKDDWY